jgi:hypothetical protein
LSPEEVFTPSKAIYCNHATVVLTRYLLQQYELAEEATKLLPCSMSVNAETLTCVLKQIELILGRIRAVATLEFLTCTFDGGFGVFAFTLSIPSQKSLITVERVFFDALILFCFRQYALPKESMATLNKECKSLGCLLLKWLSSSDARSRFSY